MNDLSNLVTSNSVPITKELKVGKNNNVIAPGMFRINLFKTSREEKFVAINQAKASIRTNPITVSQPHAITKKHVNSDSNGLSSTGVDNTAKTRRPQPMSNTKNNRVPFESKSSCIKNKEVEVEEHHRNLLLSKNKKHMSSKCNNIKLAIWNDKSEVICAMCKQCLITFNHDVCVLNYVNGMNSHVNNLYANVLKTANQKKHKPTVTKPKKVGCKERLASPKPRKPRTCLRWSPTRRMFDLKGKIIESNESESQSDCSKGDNACTSNPQEPTRKRFLNSTFSLKFLGTARFGNDHVAIILGYSDLQWGNILITRVYFVEGVGHNLFSVGQFCDSDLEVAFRMNTYFVKNLEEVDLSGLDLTYALSTITTQKPTERKLDLLFKAMYDDYISGQASAATRTALVAQAPQDVDELETQQQHIQQQDNQASLQPEIVADNVLNAMLDGNTFVNPFAPPSTSAAESSSSQYRDSLNMHTFY
ncbi:hypothetical protein Tco_0807936 [Tanacetum coccineum]